MKNKRFVVSETSGFPMHQESLKPQQRRGEVEIAILDRCNNYRVVEKWVIRVSRLDSNSRRVREIRRGANFLAEQLEKTYSK